MMDCQEEIDVEDYGEESLSEFDLAHEVDDDDEDYYDRDSGDSDSQRASSELSVDLTLVKEEILDTISGDDSMGQIPQEAHDLLQSSSYPKRKGSLKIDENYSKCSKCQKSIKTTYINRHMKLIHLVPLREYKCPEPNCDLVSMKISTVIRHLQRVHKSKTPFICKDCSERFTSRSALRQHNFEHVGKRKEETKKSRMLQKPIKFACEIPGCGKAYQRKNYLKEHHRRHTGEKKYPCEFCEKSFYSRSHMTRHLYSHTGIKNHECRWKCGATFASYGGRMRHERTSHYHDNSLHSECDICGRPFKKGLHQLRMHRLTHMNPEERKEYRCSFCSIPFDSVKRREKHEERHRDKEKIECSVCNKVFKNSRNLRDHQKKHHNSLDKIGGTSEIEVNQNIKKRKAPPKHPCHLCGPSKLFSLVSLRRHLAKIHSTNYKCPREECGKCFKEKNRYEAHMEAHRLHECHICGKKFKNKQRTDIHLLGVHHLDKEDLKELGRWQPRTHVDELPSYMLQRCRKNVKRDKKSRKDNSSDIPSTSSSEER